MSILEYAMQMEKDGEDYYCRLAQKAGNEGIKKIFTMLADEEARHYDLLVKIKTQHPQIIETTILKDAKNVFAQIKESKDKHDFKVEQTAVYKQAQDIEKKSWDFYLEKANEVKEENEKELFLKLAEEEKKHYFLLDNIIEFVSRPEHWLENAEFYHLDEY